MFFCHEGKKMVVREGIDDAKRQFCGEREAEGESNPPKESPRTAKGRT